MRSSGVFSTALPTRKAKVATKAGAVFSLLRFQCGQLCWPWVADPYLITGSCASPGAVAGSRHAESSLTSSAFQHTNNFLLFLPFSIGTRPVPGAGPLHLGPCVRALTSRPHLRTHLLSPTPDSLLCSPRPPPPSDCPLLAFHASSLHKRDR